MRRFPNTIILVLLIALPLILVAACATGNATIASASPTPTVAVPTATEAAALPPVATATPSVLVVGNTGGLGVFLRRSPAGEKIAAWPDGTDMVVIGGDDQVDGRAWKNVRDPDGNSGWAAAEFLVAP